MTTLRKFAPVDRIDHHRRSASLAMLSASSVPDVREPLSGIVTSAGNCLRMLAADPPDLDSAREAARRIIRDGNRAADVIARGESPGNAP
jgi:hypothetical protein